MAAASSSQVTNETDGRGPNATIRWRWLAVCLGLVAVAFVQDPGRIAADTKLDLTVDPGGLLARALNLWEPLGFFGQLTNQGYGYFFPMGPFFWTGDVVGIPDWVVQRLWWSVLLVTAFLGIVRLARLLGVDGFAPRLLAGLAFALGPRMVTELGVLSVEVLPYAVAPWVLIPLVAVAQGGSYRRAAALSGVAVFAAGGVNAVASAAVLPLAAWWILTRFSGRARWVLVGWWSLAVAAATLWWVLPLLLLGRYSPPFLDWIESASVTTSITAPDTIVRGTSQWVAYIADGAGPVWPSGWSLVTEPVLIAATGLVAAVGVGGLALSGGWGPRWRTFLVGGLLIGWVAVGIGHIGPWSGLGSEFMRSLLDGALAPLRNTHKFEVLIRLPIAIGVAFAVQWLIAQRGRRTSPGRVLATVGIGALVVSMTASAWPALSGELTRDRSFAELPGYWSEASSWLADQESSGRALVLPGASFGIYGWGRVNDEPLQALGETPWVVRDAVPLAGAGAIRWLDAIAERVTSGRGSPGLAAAVSRAGIDWVVIRNDLDRRRTGSARPEAIRQALIRSGGFTPVAGFGPVIPPFRTETTVIDTGLIDANTAVEIWRVNSQAAGSDPRVAVRPLRDALVVSGASEGVVDLIDAGLIGSGTVAVLDGDEASLTGIAESGVAIRRALTDSNPRSEVIFGRSWNNRTSVLTADADYAADRAVHDYVQRDDVEDRTAFQTVAVFDGGTVSASSSGSDVDAVRSLGQQSDPYSAIDGDPETAWRSGEPGSGVGQWWQVEWTEPVRIDQSILRLRLVGRSLLGSDDAPAVIEATTDQGSFTTEIDGTDGWQEIAVPRGETTRLRITLIETQGEGGRTLSGGGFGIREVDLPAPIGRSFVVPGLLDSGPAVFTAQRGERSGCLSVGGVIQCDDGLAVAGPERAGIDRQFATAGAEELRIGVRVRPRPGQALADLLTPLSADAIVAQASSTLVDDPAARPQAAVDGSLETAWIAGSDDRRPSLRLTWPQLRTVQGVRLSVDPRLAVSLPLTVTVVVNGVETTSVVDDFGRVRVPAQEATSLTLRFDNTVGLRSFDPVTGSIEPLPVGISEVTVLGANDLAKGPLPGQNVAVPCGFGPTVVIDGRVVTRTAVTMTVGEALTDAVVAATPCDVRSVQLDPGAHRLEVAASPAFLVESVVLDPIASASTGARGSTISGDVEVIEWQAAHREVVIPFSDERRLLELTENANPGWGASIDGVSLEPIRVDGWRQAWVVPPGAGGEVSVDFAPNGIYRIGLLLGAIAVAGLLVLLMVPVRRRHGAAVPGSSRARRWTLAALAMISATALVGFPGLIICAVGFVGTWRLSGRSGPSSPRQWRSVMAVAPLAASALVAAAIPWPDRSSAPEALLAVLSALTVLGLAAVAAPRRIGFPSGDGSGAESDAR